MRLAAVMLSLLVLLFGALLVGLGGELRSSNAELRDCQMREGAAALEQARALVHDMQRRAAAAAPSGTGAR